MREIKCAFCESTDVELFSLYGQTLLGSQYYCNNCRSIFESIRFDEEDEQEQSEKAAKKREQEEN